MKTQKTIISFLAVALTVFHVAAQNDQSSGQQDAEQIYNSMLQVMSGEMRSRIDSASATHKPTRPRKSRARTDFKTDKDSAVKTDPSKHGMDKLPKELRERVRKTMETIEQKKNERIIEFKENRSRNKKK
ncbi:MAG: hypothetical protein ACLFVE_02205 [Chitinispirillaceae bacterium]